MKWIVSTWSADIYRWKIIFIYHEIKYRTCNFSFCKLTCEHISFIVYLYSFGKKRMALILSKSYFTPLLNVTHVLGFGGRLLIKNCINLLLFKWWHSHLTFYLSFLNELKLEMRKACELFPKSTENRRFIQKFRNIKLRFYREKH